MTRKKQFGSALMALLLVVTGVTAGFTGAASAASGDGGGIDIDVNPFSDPPTNTSGLTAQASAVGGLGGMVDGQLNQVTHTASQVLRGTPAYSVLKGTPAASIFGFGGSSSTSNATETATNLTATWNQWDNDSVSSSKTSWSEYLNNRGVDASTDHDVHEIVVHKDGETATRYLVGNHSDGKWTGSEMVNSTGKSVDKTVHLCPYAASNIVSETKTFHEKFVSENEAPSGEYLGRVKAQYGDSIGGDYPILGSASCT